MKKPNHFNTPNIYTLLHNLTVRNSDNGDYFTDTRRLDRIADELKDSPFVYYRKAPLYHAYAQVPFEELPKKVVVISSHVDFKGGTRDCFSDESDQDWLVGTYDNSITNAAIVALMKNTNLPENLVVVFTGDEEEDQWGAAEFGDYVKNGLRCKPKCIVLDVTESGNKEGAIFAIENDCWNKKWGRRVLTWAKEKEDGWKYVPYKKSRLDKGLIKELVDEEHCIRKAADIDETATYHATNEIKCFSFCIPVELVDPTGRYAPWGEGMHSSLGLKVRKDAYEKYIQALYEVIGVSNNRPTDEE